MLVLIMTASPLDHLASDCLTRLSQWDGSYGQREVRSHTLSTLVSSMQRPVVNNKSSVSQPTNQNDQSSAPRCPQSSVERRETGALLYSCTLRPRPSFSGAAHVPLYTDARKPLRIPAPYRLRGSPVFTSSNCSLTTTWYLLS